MLRHVLFFMILIVPGIMPGVSLSSESPSQLIGEGDSFFSQRAVGHIGDRATTAPILQAISSYLSAYDDENQSPELTIKIIKTTNRFSVSHTLCIKKQLIVLSNSFC